jgi:membrane-anchored glycerophosphoryl diester phosphodiesterase (GDPDase)
MEQKLNLKQLEKNTAAVIFQTGLVDIGIGLILIVSSLAMLFDDIRYYIDILFIVPVIFIILAVRYIASPRMGSVKFARKRMKRNLWFMVTVTLFLVIMVILKIIGIGPAGDDPDGDTLVNGRWIVSGIIFFICTAIAYFLDFRRMYLYAFLMTGAFNLSEEIREHPGILPDGAYAYLLISVVLIIIGCLYLIRFLKKNPLPENMSYDK